MTKRGAVLLASDNVALRSLAPSLLSRLLATGARIDTVPISDRWFEVDSERDLALYETMLGERP